MTVLFPVVSWFRDLLVDHWSVNVCPDWVPETMRARCYGEGIGLRSVHFACNSEDHGIWPLTSPSPDSFSLFGDIRGCSRRFLIPYYMNPHWPCFFSRKIHSPTRVLKDRCPPSHSFPSFVSARERPGLFSYEVTLGQEEETFQAP